MPPLTLVVPITPVGKPRMTQRDVWKQRQCVMRYRAFADHLRAVCEYNKFVLPPSGVGITFYLPMPPSWSQKKRAAMNLTPHTQKPDLDNLLKSVMDVLLPDDSGIWQLDRLEKRWGFVGEIHFSLSSLTETP